MRGFNERGVGADQKRKGGRKKEVRNEFINRRVVLSDKERVKRRRNSKSIIAARKK